MTGYGVGSVIGTAISLAVVRRTRPVPLASVAWACMGLCWIGMGLWTTPAVVAAMGAVSGLTVVLGIAAISVVITRSSVGRRAAGVVVGSECRGERGKLRGDAGRRTDHRGCRCRAHVGRSAGPSRRSVAALVLLQCQTARHVRDRDHHAWPSGLSTWSGCTSSPTRGRSSCTTIRSATRSWVRCRSTSPTSAWSRPRTVSWSRTVGAFRSSFRTRTARSSRPAAGTACCTGASGTCVTAVSRTCRVPWRS